MLNHVEITTLPNGARVATARVAEATSAVLGIWAQVGSRHETAANNGVSHFLEHLLFKGTPTRTARQITQAIESRGGNLNAYTDEDHTCYYARLPAQHVATAFDVLSDMYHHPTLATDEIERERTVILEEIRMYRDQPQSLVTEVLAQLVWHNHPLGRPIAGTEDSVGGLTRAQLCSHHKAAYSPASTLYTFAGNIHHDACVKLVQNATARLKSNPRAAYTPVTARTPQRAIALTHRETEQIHAALAFRIFGRNTPEPRQHALRVLNTLLGATMSSRLFQAIREKHGLCYTIHSAVQLHTETGALHIYAGLDRGRAADAIRRTLREIQRLKTMPISTAELNRTKNYLDGTLRLGLESPTNRMNYLAESLLSHGKLIDPQCLLDGIRAVTAQDVQQLANDIFTLKNLSTSFVLPQDQPNAPGAWQQIIHDNLG